MISETIDYDYIFKDLDSDLIAYFKNEHVLTKYVKLKETRFSNGQYYKENDVRWCLYNDIKLKYELNKNYYNLANVLGKMGRHLYLEEKYKEMESYVISEFYCICFLTENYSQKLGTVREKDFRFIINTNNIEMTFDYFSTKIMNLIPSIYEKRKAKDIYDFLITKLKKS